MINQKVVYYKIKEEDKETFLYCKEKGKFSFSMKSFQYKDITGNSIFLIDLGNELYISNSSSKQKITSIESRIVLRNFHLLSISSIIDILNKLTQRQQKIFQEKLKYNLISLSKNLSLAIIQYLYSIDKNIIDIIIKNKKEFKNNISYLQNDAIHFAISIAKLNSTFKLEKIEVKNETETELTNLSEDKVIIFDSNNEIQGLTRNINITGKATYKSDSEELIIYTANKNDLELLFGVDLIYINNIQKNIVMIQYKMLEKEGNNWIFRDKKNQLEKEIQRMNKIQKTLSKNSQDEYRLNSSPFFLRFIKRKAFENNPISFCISLEHYQQIIKQPTTLGSKGGRVINYKEMHNHYIGKSELEGLIRSGYVGTYAKDTKECHDVIEQIARSNSKNSLVIAFQNKLEKEN
ncbi:hypothetical protein F9B74_05875 [Pelistega sp. NLN82]|uniref:Uncharacterized protein n=1 Tax=Pelistega ratti TaxID=2652177 RepID=A0A6L9Y679_9BURK|nr:hypothetical protein [Pelistega ratti]NEN75853.1 hypothetical protein [Pelistega ratti]